MSGPRPRYSSFDKSRYLAACKTYREACASFYANPGAKREFIAASLAVQALRGLVPKTWRTQAFING